MIHHNDIGYWVDDPASLKPEFTPIPVWNPIQFFKLQGKRTVIARNNMEPIKDVRYCVYAKSDQRYYIRKYRNYDLDVLFFYKENLHFSGKSEAVESLRRYIADNNVTLLLNKKQFDEIDEFLLRLWKSHYVEGGKVQYKHYIALAEQYLRLEDYRSYSSGLLGSKTVVTQFESRLRSIWDEIYGIKK